MTRCRNFFLLFVLFVSTTAFSQPAAQHEDLDQSVRSFTRILDLVENNYATSVDAGKAIFQGAIPGMLRTLDPHSRFFDPKEFQEFREEQQGRYFGVGMTIGVRDGSPTVLQPYTDSPAFKAGLRPADVILSIDGKPASGLSVNEVADMLKGARGTRAKITVSRFGAANPIAFELVRDEIPERSVPDAFWFRPGLAYIGIAQFNENTSKELEEAVQRLGEQNFQGLLLDLRGNPGGILNECVAVADRFLKKGQTIVSHRGRSSPEQPYIAKRGNRGFDYPIVILVNGDTASASEIVAGALQDHDRAWIMGDSTFGKGLVQTPYPLSENAGLTLTTAKYYTPSGRLIQREYANISILGYYYARGPGARGRHEDSKKTDSGRDVYGGGGITPDEKYTEPGLGRLQNDLIKDSAFFEFAPRFLATGPSKLPPSWMPDLNLLEEFHDFLLTRKITFSEAEFTFYHDWIRLQLRRQVLASLFGSDEGRRLDIETDPEVDLAAKSMPKARALFESSRKLLVQK